VPRFVSKPRVVGGIEPTDPLDLATKDYVDGVAAVGFNIDGGQPATIYGGIDPVSGGDI